MAAGLAILVMGVACWVVHNATKENSIVALWIVAGVLPSMFLGVSVFFVGCFWSGKLLEWLFALPGAVIH